MKRVKGRRRGRSMGRDERSRSLPSGDQGAPPKGAEVPGKCTTPDLGSGSESFPSGDLQTLADVGQDENRAVDESGIPWGVRLLPRRLEPLAERLRSLLNSLPRPKTGFQSRYDLSGDEPPGHILFAAVLACHDPYRRRETKVLREYLRTNLPKCFSRGWPKRRGVKYVLPLKERNAIHPANKALLALYRENQTRPTPETVLAAMRPMFPDRAEEWQKRWDGLRREVQAIIDRAMPPFEKARDTLACLLSVERSLIDKYLLLKPRQWRDLGEED